MKEKIKQNVSYLICAALGLLYFIFLAFPYIEAFVDYGYFGTSSGIGGYRVMDLWSGGFSGVMSSMIQIIILILNIALLAWGAMGLLKAFGHMEKFPEKVGNFESKKICKFGLIGLSGLNVLLFIFLIILSASNTESNSYGSSGFRLSAGIFVSIIFTVGATVAAILLEKKFADSSGETIISSCKNCNKKAKPSDKFCSACGGEIEKKVSITIKEEFVCSKCNRKTNGKDKFCSACGGEIIRIEPGKAENEEPKAEQVKVTENEEPKAEQIQITEDQTVS